MFTREYIIILRFIYFCSYGFELRIFYFIDIKLCKKSKYFLTLKKDQKQLNRGRETKINDFRYLIKI